MPAIQEKVNEQSYSVVELLESEYDMILEKLGNLELLALKLDNSKLETEHHIEIFKLNNFIYSELMKYFHSEEDYLFKELSRLMPDPSSTRVMADEHFEILRVCNKIQSYLSDEDAADGRKDEIQGLIYYLGGILRRHIQRKNIMLHHEVSLLIPEDTKEYLYREMYKKTHR